MAQLVRHGVVAQTRMVTSCGPVIVDASEKNPPLLFFGLLVAINSMIRWARIFAKQVVGHGRQCPLYGMRQNALDERFENSGLTIFDTVQVLEPCRTVVGNLNTYSCSLVEEQSRKAS